MKKISLILTFVLLMAALLAMSVFAASFTRGPEGETITAEDVESIELISGSTHSAGYISVAGALDGNFSTWWGGPKGSAIKITFINEWEINSAKAVLAANWCGGKFTFYAADGTAFGSHSLGGFSANTGLCWGGDATNADRTDLDGAGLSKLAYGDNDKAVKYVVFENTGDKWGYLPMMAELILTGRERTPSVGCENHEFVPVYSAEPTCTTDGTYVNTCTLCGAEESPATAPALGHNMGEYYVKVPATCTESPVFEYSCTRCGEVLERPSYIKDVTDYADIYTSGANGAGGNTTSHRALFDNNMDSYLHASGQWFVESWIELDMPYYLTSVTVWTGSYSNNVSWEANFTFWYQAPGSDEWIEVGTKDAGVSLGGVKYEHTMELAEPVYADAIKIKVNRLGSFDGQAFEAEIAGTVFPEAAPLGHTWEVTNTVVNTCTSVGYTESTCTVCGATRNDDYVKVADHTYADATCTAPQTCVVCAATKGNPKGHSYFYECDKVCQVCNEESRPEATHTLVHVDAVAPTCTTNGNVEYWYCSVCGYAWLDEACTLVTNQMSVVVPAAHSYFYDCDKVCQVCFEETNPDATHTIEHVDAVPADCTNNGNVEYWYCSICNYAWLDEACTLVANRMSIVDPATGHEWDEGYFMGWPYPSCQNPTGTKTYTCNVCYESYDEENVSVDLSDPQWHAAELEWETYQVATCISGGYEKYVCADCGEVFEIVTEADTEYGHEWIVDESVSYDATCIEDGFSKQTCSICEATRELVLDKEFYGNHAYGYDPETYVEATCIADGYAFYSCELCGDTYEETTSAGAWLHNYVTSNNGIIATCATCNAVTFGNAEFTGENGLTAMFVWEGTALNIWNSEYDVYYDATIVSNENGVIVVELYSDDDAFGINGETAVLTLKSNGGTLVITAGETVYTLVNEAPDYNYLLNGTYAYYDMMGNVNAMFKFEDGIITVLVDNMGMGFPETFSYVYDAINGVIYTPEVQYANFTVYDGVIYFGRGFELVPVEDVPVEPEEPVNYGDLIGSITVETTDTYGYFDLYSYTANKAGQYSFYVPAGLGFYSKAQYDVFGNAEIGFYDNANGYYVVVDLAAGETIEFYVGAIEKATWSIGVYFYTDHVHTEVEIPAVLPTPSVEGFTAGIICSDCGETIKAPVAINVTEMANTKDPSFRIASASLDLAENISVFYKSIVTSGYNNPYMVFVFGGEEFVVTDYTIESGTGRYVYRFSGAPAYKMAENIEAYVYAETAEGEYSYNKILEYSVMTYCVNQLKKNASDPVYVNVISDVLTLGAANQIFEGFNTDKLVTDLVEAQGYTLTPSEFTSIDASKNVQTLTGDRTQGTDWKSAGMLLGSNIKVQLKFETDNLDGLTVKVNVAGEDRYFTAEDFTMDGKRYVVTVDYLTSKQYDEVITATFFRGEEQIGSTLTYSVNSYIYRNVSSATGAKAALLKAIYVYGETMKAFFK